MEAMLSLEERLRLYRLMVLSRRLDDLEIQLKRQNLTYFQISGAGHEATLAAASLYLRSGHDWFLPYYRDRALLLGLGVTPLEMLLAAVGAAADPASGGRQMPSHWGHATHRIVSQSSCTGTQFLHAVGIAEGRRFARDLSSQARGGISRTASGGESAEFTSAERGRIAPSEDEVVYVSGGDGTTSQGEFFEALNSACLSKLPVLFHIEDNGYAISVPIEVQTAGGSISKLVSGFPDLLRLEFDGCDPEASAANWQQAVAHARQGLGPVLLHAHVVRSYSHSLSDDEAAYRGHEEIEADARRDPIHRYRDFLLGLGIDTTTLGAIAAEVEREAQAARQGALAAAPPDPASATLYVYSPDVDPKAARFSVEPSPVGAPLTLVDAINTCLAEELEHDPHVVVFGEDVADASREAALPEVKGKGGVFKATWGLQRRFGSRRVFNAPLAEASIVGRAVGMALAGLKPVVEIQFFDYIWPAMMQLRSEVALMRWRSCNAWKCPLVIRATYGGYLKGGAVYHSQTGETLFTHTPGIRVVLPSNAEDAMGLLRTAIRCDDPVLFLEHKHLYRQTYNRAPHPGASFTIPFGCARRVRQGTRVTVVTYGALVKRCLDAVAAAGVDADVWDLRTLSPYDFDSIATSVRATHRLLIAHEEPVSWGFGAEIAARAASDLFEWLDAPVRRIGSLDTFVGYHPVLEDAILPQTEQLVTVLKELLAY